MFILKNREEEKDDVLQEQEERKEQKKRKVEENGSDSVEGFIKENEDENGEENLDLRMEKISECYCGIKAKEKTVENPEKPTFWMKFYGCSKYPNGCQFFRFR